jgi:ribosomal protein L3 glutamine methyltransferase
MRRLSHTAERLVPLESVGAAIERCARALQRARVHFGHGTDNARDEAAELVFYVARIDHAEGAAAYDRPLTARRRARIDALLQRRITERIPLAYLTSRAFFAGLELYVDARVLVPRSPIAELIQRRFAPWNRRPTVRRILDVGTGSGAIALACAKAFPRARVDAVDISTAALAVCRRNVRRLGLTRRVRVPLRYHREQSALRRTRRIAQIAARVWPRAGARAQVRDRWSGLGASHFFGGAAASGR